MGQQTSSLLPFLILIALAGFMLFRGSRQRRELQAIQDSLTPGMDVMTSSGMFGTVQTVDDAVVVLETAPGQTSRWDRRAITRVVPTAVAAASPEPAAPSEPNE